METYQPKKNKKQKRRRLKFQKKGGGSEQADVKNHYHIHIELSEPSQAMLLYGPICQQERSLQGF